MSKHTLALAFAAVLAVCLEARADPVLELSSGATTVTIPDGGVLDSNGSAGAVTYIGAVGSSFSSTVPTGLTKPTLGTATTPNLDLNAVVVSSASGTLTMKFTETGFTAPVPPGFILDAGGTTEGLISFKAFYDLTNTPFGEGVEITDLGPFSGGAFSGSSNAPASLTGPYSLTLVATITHSGAATTSFNASLTPNPEPGTMLLLGFALAGFGFVALRRRRLALSSVC